MELLLCPLFGVSFTRGFVIIIIFYPPSLSLHLRTISPIQTMVSVWIMVWLSSLLSDVVHHFVLSLSRNIGIRQDHLTNTMMSSLHHHVVMSLLHHHMMVSLLHHHMVMSPLHHHIEHQQSLQYIHIQIFKLMDYCSKKYLYTCILHTS